MKYELNYLPDKEIVSVKFAGRLNFQRAGEFSMEATKLARQNNCNKYLIDHTDTDLEQGIYKLHTDGSTLERFGFKSTDRVAIIISGEKDSHYFNESRTNEAGICDIKYFDSINEAENWLINN